jgi:hypothetical protein
MFRYKVAALLVCLWIGVPAMATTVKGRVKNGTTGKPAAGDEVVLLSLAERGPKEVGRGKTDSAGRYDITVAGMTAPAMVRVEHQGVGYQAKTPPDAGTVDVNVYDVARTLDAVTATWDVRLQADGDSLKVIDEIAVLNASDPPRALLNARPFAIELPPEAEVLAGAIQTAGGQAVKVKPVRGDRKGDYYFPFPLIPGENRFAVAWRLPYRGNAVIEPGIPYPLKKIVVMHPDSMAFEPQSPGLFEAKSDESLAIVKETALPEPGRSPAFRVSGTGTLAKVRDPKQRPQVAHAASSHRSLEAPSHGSLTAPSHGGPADPVRRPGPVPKDRRILLGGLIAVLVAGTVVLRGYKRQQRRSPPSGPGRRRT